MLRAIGTDPADEVAVVAAPVQIWVLPPTDARSGIGAGLNPSGIDQLLAGLAVLIVLAFAIFPRRRKRRTS